MAVLEFLGFQINQDVAFQYPVIKNQVDKIIFIIDQDSFLPCFKAEAMAKFQKKHLQMIKNGLFKVSFGDQGTEGIQRLSDH